MLTATAPARSGGAASDDARDEARPMALLAALAGSGVRLTGPRRHVVELVDARTGHFTAADLIADAAGSARPTGRATIFRSLELLLALGLVERLDLPSGEHAYVRCEPAHHHHVVCSACGRSVEVDELGLDTVAREVERRTGFRIEGHRLELYGRCPACRSEERTAG